MSESLIPDFLQDLEKATSKKSNFTRSASKLQKINFRSPKNQGRAIIVPIGGKNPDESPIKQLNQVARVERWVSGKRQDGSEYGFTERLYFFLDPKYYGTLTPDQEDQLNRMKGKFNTLSNSGHQSISTRQLTLIQGLALKHTDRSNPVKTIYEHVPAIYEIESKNFEKNFRSSIVSMVDTLGGYGWLQELANREVKRKRYLDIEFYRPEEGGAYNAQIKFGKFDEDVAKTLTEGKIGLDLSGKGQEFLDLFEDPIKTWLNLPQDQPRWNDDYMNMIEGILNNYLGAETPSNKAEVKKEEPTVPDSNSGFLAQPETPVVPPVAEPEQHKEADPEDPAF